MKVKLLLIAITFWATSSTAQFNETAKFVASDRSANSELGIDVDIDGAFAIGGAYRDSFDANGNNELQEAGSAYIFENDGNGNWTQAQKLVASDRELFAAFGISVAISGSYAVVGAQLEDKDENGANPLNNAGAAYIYERDGSGTWIEVQKIVSSTRTNAGGFGWPVKITGNTIMVGSFLDSTDEDGNNFIGQSGGVFIFERDNNGTWNQTQKIVATDRGSGDNFGRDVEFDGDYAVIGAFFDSQDANGNVINNSGTAYVFEKDGSGTWIEAQKIVGSDRTVNDRYGMDVAIDGNIIVVGAGLHNDDASGGNPIPDAGAVYIYERDGNGVWNEIQKIVNSDRAETDVFGKSVSIDGDYLAVSAYLHDFDENGANQFGNAGAAYIFEKNSGGTNNWGQVQKIVTSDRFTEDRFGYELILKDGILLTAAAGQDQDPSGNNNISNAGMLYVFGDPALSVTEQTAQVSLLAYPNPFQDRITLWFGKNYNVGEITITNVLGQQVYTTRFSNKELLELELEIPTGMYLVTLKTNHGETATMKIAKQ